MASADLPINIEPTEESKLSDDKTEKASTTSSSSALTLGTAATANSADWELVEPPAVPSLLSAECLAPSASSSSSVEVLLASETEDALEDADSLANNVDEIGVELLEDNEQQMMPSSMQASGSTVATTTETTAVQQAAGRQDDTTTDSVQQQQQQPLISGPSEQRIIQAIRLLQNTLPASSEQPAPQGAAPPSPPSTPTPPPEPEPARLRIIRRWLAYDEEDINEAERESPPESDIGLADPPPPAAGNEDQDNNADYGHVLPAMLATAARQRQRQYCHRPNDPVNCRLTVLCLLALAFATGLGLGHFFGCSGSGRDGRLLIGCRAWRADQASRSRALRRDLAACTRRYDDLELTISELKTTLVQKEYVDKWESLYAESEEEKDALRVAMELYKTRYNREKAKNEELGERLAEAERVCNATQSNVQIEQLKSANAKLLTEAAELRSKIDSNKLANQCHRDWLFGVLSNGTAAAAKVGCGLFNRVNNASDRLLRKLSNSSSGVMMKKFTNATVALFRKHLGDVTNRLLGNLDKASGGYLANLPKRYFNFSMIEVATVTTEDKTKETEPPGPAPPSIIVAKDAQCVISNAKNREDLASKASTALRWSLDGRAEVRAKERKIGAKEIQRLGKLNRRKGTRHDWYARRLQTRQKLRGHYEASKSKPYYDNKHFPEEVFDDADSRLNMNERSEDVEWGVGQLKAAVDKVTTRLARIKEKFLAAKQRRWSA